MEVVAHIPCRADVLGQVPATHAEGVDVGVSIEELVKVGVDVVVHIAKHPFDV